MARSFNGYNIKYRKPGGFKSQKPQASIAYGNPTKDIPSYNEGCQFHTPEGFCNAACKGAYCTDHALICGGKYKQRALRELQNVSTDSL